MGVFKIQGFVRKRFLPSPPLPPPFFFWLSLALAPFSAQAKYRKPRSSVFLCSQTLRKRLLRRLPFCQLSVIGHILTNRVLRCWADGGLKTLKRVCRVCFSPSSPPGHITLLSRRLLLYTGNPYITYWNSTWSSTYVTNLNRIYCLQKHAVWAITSSDYRTNSAPLFSKLKILDIYQLNTFQIAKFMHCYHNNLLLPLFFNLFFTNNQTHGYSTRTANNYRTRHCRTNLKKFTILYQGPKIWNSLPVQITSLPSFPNFKKKPLEFLVK